MFSMFTFRRFKVIVDHFHKLQCKHKSRRSKVELAVCKLNLRIFAFAVNTIEPLYLNTDNKGTGGENFLY